MSIQPDTVAVIAAVKNEVKSMTDVVSNHHVVTVGAQRGMRAIRMRLAEVGERWFISRRLGIKPPPVMPRGDPVAFAGVTVLTTQRLSECNWNETTSRARRAAHG